MTVVHRGTSRRIDTGLAALIGAVLILSLGSTVSKKVGAPGIVVASTRSLLAFVVWMGILTAQRRHLTLHGLRTSLLPGALFGVNIAFFFSAVQHTNVANVEFLGSLTPLIVVPAGALLFHEHIPWRAARCGASPRSSAWRWSRSSAKPRRAAHDALGLTLAVCAIVTWSLYIVLIKHMRSRIDVGEFMAGSTLFAGLILLPLAIQKGGVGTIPARGWPWMILLTVMNGVVAHTLLLVAEKTVPVGSIATIQVSQPALAALAAWLLLGEAVTGGQLFGMVIVIASLVMYTLTVQRSRVVLENPG